MEIKDTSQLIARLDVLAPPPGLEIWMQECIDNPDTPDDNERRQIRNGAYDDLLVAWANATGSTGVSDHTSTEDIRRIRSVVPGALVMTCYPGRNIKDWSEWSVDIQQRVDHYRLDMEEKFAPCSRVFINFEDAKKIRGKAVEEAVVSRFLWEITATIREFSPGCQISNYNEGMYYAEHKPWRGLPMHNKFGNFDCLSGYPDDVGIQSDFIDASMFHSHNRPFQLCIWPQAAFHRRRYHLQNPFGRFDKIIVRWPSNLYACRHHRAIGLQVGTREECRGVLVHRPDLLSFDHVNILAALYEGIVS